MATETNWEQNAIHSMFNNYLKEQKTSRRWKIFFRLMWLIIIIGGFFSFYGNKNINIISGKKVALIKLNGIISKENNSYEIISQSLNNALKDKNTLGVIIAANSPGGSPVYSDMLYHEIIKLRSKYPTKAINVAVEEVCASGCYYIAAAANKIYANPASIIGSIGVIYPAFGLTGLIQKIGIDSRLLISGKNKAMGYPFTPINPAQNAMQQHMLDQIHQQFITAVKMGRGARLVSNNPELFSGRYWIGVDSLKLGLIDGFANVKDIAIKEFNTDNIEDYTQDENTIDKMSKKFGMDLVDGVKSAINSEWFYKFF